MARNPIDRQLAKQYLKMLDTGTKTAVSLAMELATRLGVLAQFDEAKDLKWTSTFKYYATLGDIQAVGVGSSKKEAKQNSAKELIKLIKSENESGSFNIIRSPASPMYETAEERYSPFSSPVSSSSMSESPFERNFVGELQNLAAKNKWDLPDYHFDEPTGEPHSKTFTCLVRMLSNMQCTGEGSSKKSAKKQAAEKMLNILQGDDYDMVDAQTPMSKTSPQNLSNSSPEILDNSDYEEYNSDSSSASSSTATKLDLSNEITEDIKYDDLSQQKLQSCSAAEDFQFEYINLPSKSKKGQYQVFLKLTFVRNAGQRHPIVTHGSGETVEIAKSRAASRAMKHLELMLSVQ